MAGHDVQCTRASVSSCVDTGKHIRITAAEQLFSEREGWWPFASLRSPLLITGEIF